MTNDKRVNVVAAIALSKGLIVRSIFDYANNIYVNFNARINNRNINIFNYNQGSYFSGMLPSMFDYATATYINININGNQVNGFDYGSACYFNGSVQGRMITIFDYEQSSYYNYSVL